VSGSRAPAIWSGGRRKLSADPTFAALVAKVGPVRIPVVEGTPFEYLARAIVYQQLAGKAASTIHGRLVAALGGEVSPERILRTRDSTLREAGLSAAKTAAVRDLAVKARTGEVALGELDAMSDEQVVKRLTRVRGIGPWTAHMYLMFRLQRPDVWPVGDLGVRAGWARLHGLVEPPKERDMLALGEGYRPWRSAVAWYCWRALED